MITQMIILFMFLLISAVSDIREKKVYTAVVVLMMITGAAVTYGAGILDAREVYGGVAVGVLLYIISALSGEKIGKGDALLVLASGVFLGTTGNLIMLCISMFIAGIAGIFSMIFLKKKRDFELPFVPFMSVALLVMITMELQATN